MSGRVVMHVDMDAFFASVEQRDDPALRGRPVVVGGTGRRGVVAAASYEARRYGVHSAMPVARARRLCPAAVFVAPRHGLYAEVSRAIGAVLERFSPLVEPLSIDEAFVDLTGTERLLGPPRDVARRVKAEIRAAVDLTASAGVAPTKFLAKIASDLEKPDGLVVVGADEVEAFLRPLPVERLWGAGKVTTRKLHALGLATIGDVADVPREHMERHFGALGTHLWLLAHGIDEREVVPGRDAESIGHEETFERDIATIEALLPHLLDQAERVASRLRHAGCHAAGVRLKLKEADFSLHTRQTLLDAPTDDGAVLYREVVALARAHGLPRPVRLCGVAAFRLVAPDTPRQLSLLEPPARVRAASRIGAAMDAIRDRFGPDAVLRGDQLAARRDAE